MEFAENVRPTMDQPPPPERETPEQRLERISKMPGVIVHRNPNPTPWEPPTDIRVINVTDINQLTGDDADDEADESNAR